MFPRATVLALRLLALATSAGMFGGWLYVLQRDHVRATIAERQQ